MIVLKHLANEFDIDPYKLRMFLRNTFGKRRRWRWEETDPDLPVIKKAIADHKKKT